jgi:DNA polymerase III delta prime subunit
MEEFSANCRFILTCNFKNRIIEPLHSRCTCINFQIPTKERPALAKQMLQRVKGILDTEGVAYDDKVLVELIMKHFPDFRRILNELQRYSVSGKIDVGILTQLGEIKIKELISALKGKDFTSVRKWVVENSDADSASLFRKIYESMYECFAPSSIPKLVLILAEYQYKAAFVADAEINMTACLTEIMMECEFK